MAEGLSKIAGVRFGRSRSIARAVEATTVRPGRAFASPRRISTNAAISPFGLQVDVSARGAAWITWGAAPREGASTTFSALKSRKLTVRTGRFSRELTVLRARTGFRDERLTSNFQVLAGRGGSMLAVVERARTRASGEQPDPAGPPVGPATGVNFFQLRTYGE